jgi:tight adherence protein C
MNAASLARNSDLLLFVGFLIACGAFYYYRWRVSPDQRIAERIRSFSTRVVVSPEGVTPPPAGNKFFKQLIALGEKLPLFDQKQRVALALALTRAGFRNRRAVSAMVSVKFIFGLALALVALTFGRRMPVFGDYLVMRIIMMFAGFIVGMIIPEYLLGMYSKRRRRIISSCLPDALDLLVICTNAGNSLIVGLRRVSRELAQICPPLSDELTLTANEMQMGGENEIALRSLAERVDVDSVRGLVSTLIQSAQYGTPITQALRVLSKTERTAHMMTLEEKAAKLAPKMTLPMMFFILPTVLLIAAGPAILQLIKVFSGLTQ